MILSISNPEATFLASTLATVVERGIASGQDAEDAYAGVKPVEGGSLVEATGANGVTAVAVEAQAGGALGHWRGFLGYTSNGDALAAEGFEDLLFVLKVNGLN